MLTALTENPERKLDTQVALPQHPHSLDLTQILDEYDKAFLSYLVRMGHALSGNEINLHDVKNTLEAIETLKKSQDQEYLKSMVYPERAKNAKIPSAFPIPSASFQLKSSINLTPNSSGNACLLINPFFLAEERVSPTAQMTSIYLNNHSTLTGSAANNNFIPIDGGQFVPPNVYDQYRLVSASVVVKYIGRLDTVQGLIGGSIIFDDKLSGTSVSNTVVPSLAKYGNFNMLQDAYFWQEFYSIHGMRELYFPLDITFEQYHDLDKSKDGFGFALYLLTSTSSNSPTIKIDLFFNFECLPTIDFLNFMPTSSSTSPVESKEQAVREIQKRPIMSESQSLSEKHNLLSSSGPGFWDRIISKMGDMIPGLNTIVEIISKIKNLGPAFDTIFFKK